MSGSAWAVITGASSGLGVEFARSLAHRNTNLALVARREAPMQELAEELRTLHQIEVFVCPQDLSKVESADALTRELTGRGIEPEILINNAAFGMSGEFLGQDLARIQQMLDIDVKAPVILSQIFGKQMRERGRGHIVLVGSMAAYQPTPRMAVYGAAKHFILALGEALHVELAPSVSVTVVSPGLMETEFFSVSGYTPKESLKSSMMTAKDVADAAVDAMYKKKSSVVVGRLNRIAAFSARFFSRHTLAKLVYRMSQE